MQKSIQGRKNKVSITSEDGLSIDSSSSEELDIEIAGGQHFLDYPALNEFDQLPPDCVEAQKQLDQATIAPSTSEYNGNSNYSSHKGPIVEKPTTNAINQFKEVRENNAATPLNAHAMRTSNVDSVYSILSMLGSYNSSDITSKFLEFSKSREMCGALRRSGCISLLVQIIHSDPSEEVRRKSSQALHNIVHSHPDDKSGRREARVLKLIEQLFEYCDYLRTVQGKNLDETGDRYFPIQAIGTLMKISFDEEHRYAMCQLGGLQTISTLIQLDHDVHGPISTNSNCITMRRYAGMTLTNLTFGDGNNKALLCSNKNFMKALVDQINSSSDELVQVTASVIRNLSWRADGNMKEVLNEIGTVKVLTTAAMKCTMENTLKAILSALWNLSNHCAKNKAEFCCQTGAIEFLIDMLLYEAPSKTMAVIENTGGILRNISSHIATKEEYRVILRGKNCFQILLQQLKSPSLTVVSNSCGTLGNLSAGCLEDQKYLRDNGAIPMLRSLIYSKHKMISTGSTIALRNLLGCKSNVAHNENLDSVAKMMDLKELPTLNVRKQRHLEDELGKNLSVGYETDEVSSPSKEDKIKDFASSKNTEASTSVDCKEIDCKSSDSVENIEDDEESPINFSMKYSNESISNERSEFQETNLDQITNYSLRYAEGPTTEEDATQRYDTEGTPRIISGATSMTDLRSKEAPKIAKNKILDQKKEDFTEASCSGIQSPEKTYNYCVEGTPGDFSRNDSLSDLDESKPIVASEIEKLGALQLPQSSHDKKKEKEEKAAVDNIPATPKSVTFLADETPLMFSRTSSMGSLESAEPACIDDKSSIVSDFSRLASGIISPMSELPDSPTQSVPQSPRRLQPRMQPLKPSDTQPGLVNAAPVNSISALRLQSIFEDDTNHFNIENTPAQFSYATSLSNLSFDDEPKISTDAISKEFRLMSHPSEEREDNLTGDSSLHKGQDDEEPICAESLGDAPSDCESTHNDDNLLLESCINMGINRVTQRVTDINIEKAQSSQVDQTDNDGSVISDTDDGILEACIRDGMPKFPTKVLKENPVDMMRTGAPLLPPYLPVSDELNRRFHVEDSPCNFSVMSGLSAITMESKGDQVNRSSKEQAIKQQKVDYDDSLSSLSIEDENDGNLLSQAIAAGVNSTKTKQTYPINIPSRLNNDAAANDSISSVESCDSRKGESNSILEQCIQSGINKVVKKDSGKAMVTSSPKKSMLPTFNKASTAKAKPKNLDKKDEELLLECIKSGIQKSVGGSDMVNNFAQMSLSQELVNATPKNVKTTSAIVVDARGVNINTKGNISSKSIPFNTVAGVEDADNQQVSQKMTNNSNSMNNSYRSATYNHFQAAEDCLDGSCGKNVQSPPAKWKSGSNGENFTSVSGTSIDSSLLERSNEYPAGKLMGHYDQEDDSIMELSNEFLIEHDNSKIENKHKDPDLMLKSVDRLTHELVTTAEYLRKNGQMDDLSDQMKLQSSSSNNTWTDEMSFPSISLSAPVLASSTLDTMTTDKGCSQIFQSIPQIDDATPTNEQYGFSSFGPKSVADSLEFQEYPNISFKVGGEIKNQPTSNFCHCGPTSIETCSTMSNSTIVAAEANKLSNKLNQMSTKLMDSTNSLDLEMVRPPSSMDCVSLTSYNESATQSPLFLNRFAKKSLITGLVAKRALGQHIFGGSVESINSINNIDNIRPPSIMDDLLDSMISVDSIVSEVVDTTLMVEGFSQYETAHSDIDDSLTLRSCMDLSRDENATPLGSSDFSSSAESTPTKQKRNMRSVTPKQKRQSEKDRYKTYTIAVDMLLKDQKSSSNPRQKRRDDRQRFETQIIETSSPESRSPNRRQLDPERFKTRTINTALLQRQLSHDKEDLSLQAMTDNFEFIKTGNTVVSPQRDTATLLDKLNKIRGGNVAQLAEDSLEYEHQNSETESCRDLNHSLSQIDDLSPKKEETSATESMAEQIKVVRTKNSYISPYRMTKATPTKLKSLKVTKTPIIAKIVTRSSSVEPKTPNSTPKHAVSKTGLLNKIAGANRVQTTTPTKSTDQTKLNPPVQINRQGTFIKDEPTINNVPVIQSPVKLTPASKMKQPKVLSRFSSAPAGSSEKKTQDSTKKSSNLPVASLKFRSNSNVTSIKKEIATVKTPVRSNTGISLNPRKNITSRIAGLWKSVDKKDCSPSSKTGSNNQLNKTPISGIATRKSISSFGKDSIKRSSTFDRFDDKH